MLGRVLLSALLVGLLAALSTASSSPAGTSPPTLFDDFDYGGVNQSTELAHHGWKVRAAQGLPGILGAHWSQQGISFVPDPARHGNRLLRLTSSTDGTPAGISQAQICQQRKFFAGTYATRVRFTDTPDSGADGDKIVETFYAISPLKAPLDPNYSELDWEYLPNGGWGVTAPTIFVTSWETFRLEPYVADNTSNSATGSLDGWHTLVLQVAHRTIRYYLDGHLLATHGGKYYPEVPMSIDYNLWFIAGGQLRAGRIRRYHEDVDWVYYQARSVLSPQQVVGRVAGLRRRGVAFRDSVPPESPPLASRCNF
jgi:hypothetical protein